MVGRNPPLARWHSSEKADLELGGRKAAESEKLFVILAKSGTSQDMREVDCEGSPSPSNHYMVDTGGQHLKRARSPPRLAQLHSVNHGPATLVPPLVFSGHPILGSSGHLPGSCSGKGIMLVASMSMMVEALSWW